MSMTRAATFIPVSLAACAIVLALVPTTADAATIAATSCDRTAVQNAINAAASGDTVTVPAGSCAWTGNLTVTKAIHIKANGAVTITNNNTSASDLITLVESPEGNIRLSGFTFVRGLGPSNEFGHAMVGMDAGSGGKPILVDGNTFVMGGSGNAIAAATNRGVIWNNTFRGTPSGGNCLNNASALRHKGAPPSSWVTPSTFGAADTGGDQHLYFEQNTMTDVLEGVDVDDNARTVIRYNTITNSAILSHGADTSSTGGRYFEAYNNTFNWDTSVKCAPDMPTNANVFISLRGGTALIHNNSIPDIRSQAWGDKSEISFQFQNLRRNAGPFACWNQGYPGPRQVGWGYTSGTRVVGGVRQDSEPVYIWSNTGGGNYGDPALWNYSPNECGSGAGSITSYVVAGRDYFLNSPKPGYTPYTYPHPLRSGATTPTPPPNPTPPPTPPPAPPPAPQPTTTPPTTTPVPTVALAAAPNTIHAGSSATLSWSSTHATSCSASSGWSGTKATSGSISVSPTANTMYSLTCTGAGGTGSANTTVYVTLPQATPPQADVENQLIRDLQAQIAALQEQIAQLKLLLQLSQPGNNQGSQPAAGGFKHRVCSIVNRDLSFGARGEDVARLQDFLRDQGHFYESSTGFFGRVTENALKDWQNKQAIVNSGTPESTGWGKLGPRTRAAITRWCGGL